MEVQTYELYVSKLFGLADYRNHIAHGDTKLVLGQSGGDVGVRVGSHVGVQAEGHAGRLSLGSCQLVDDLQLRNALYVEAEDVVVESEVNLPITLAYAGEDDFRAGEACLHTGFYLAAAYAVGSQSSLTDNLQQLGVGIGLDGVVYHESLVSASLVVNGAQRLAQQFCIVIVEGSLYLLQLLYRELSFCHLVLVS